MVRYVIKRILLTILILFGVSIVLYTLVRLMPSDYVDLKFSAALSQGTLSPEQFANYKKLLGIGDNSFKGIISGYWNWLSRFVRGDMGDSFLYGEPVAKAIARHMWISFGISGVALIFQFAISIPLGIKAAVNQYGVLDYTVTIIVMIGISLPSFFLGNLMIKIFSVELGWLPAFGLTTATANYQGWALFIDKLKHLIMPMFVLVVLSIGSLMRYTRTNTLEVLNADYIRTARAKGCSEKTVIYKHAFRNTMVPIVTLLAGILPSLFGGAMITEEVFAIPGIGQMAYKATTQGDVPFIMGYNMFMAVLTIIGTFFSDIMYAIVDPRVKITK